MPASKRKQKIHKPPILFERSQRIIGKLEKHLGSRFVAYWTSQSGSVCQDDVVVLYEHCSEFGPEKEPISMFVKSDGGSGRAALRIINLLRRYTSHLTAMIPLECASAATMMALGADEIHMGPMGYLTAIDASLRHELSPTDIDNELVSVSQDELTRVLRLWKAHTKETDKNPLEALMPYVHPLVVGAVDRASSLSIRLCREILSYHMKDAKRAERISAHLNSEYPSHNYPITEIEARRIGLNIKHLDAKVNELLLELHQVYSEMGQKALTDHDEQNYHNNEISNIVERRGKMIYYQTDKDWHYRREERRWVPLNDNSSWRRVERVKGRTKHSVLHIR